MESARGVIGSLKEPVTGPQGTRSVPLSGQGGREKRVFVGTVTKVFGRSGIVDKEILFHETSVKGCKIPPVGAKVLVEATFDPNCATFKWNTQRVQVVSGSATFSIQNRSGSPDRETAENETARRRSRSPVGERPRRSRSRTRSRSPPRRRPRSLPKYSFYIPKVSLQETQLGVMDVKRRYPNLYVPSDFFCARIRWQDSLPITSPLCIYHENAFHILPKGSTKNIRNTDLYPTDASFKYAAKVMLMNSMKIQDMVKQCCALEEGSDAREAKPHPTRVLEFLVGVKQNRWNQTAALGGPWSEELDGPNPDEDPEVLVRTAIRTVRSLAGVDLSVCTRWYRIVDVHYCRVSEESGQSGGKPTAEMVVMFLPDVWRCLPTAHDWDRVVKWLCEDLPASSPVGGAPHPAAASLDVGKSALVSETCSTLCGRVDEGDAASCIPCETFPLRLVERQGKLPTAPHILASPSTTAKNGKYDCTIMSLAKLLDYRPEDKKEKAFEVGLFAELFNEMLLRDFGFVIYKALLGMPERTEKKDRKEKQNESSEDGGDSRRPKKPRFDGKDLDGRYKLADPHLLLAFTYFDVSNCGFIAEKDLEDLLLLLGLLLSRSQAKRLVQKAATNGVINYKRLVARPFEDNQHLTSHSLGCTEDVARGNLALIRDEPATMQRGGERPLVTWRDVVVDVPNLLTSLEATEKAVGERDVRLEDLTERLGDALSKISNLEESEAENRAEIEKVRDQLTRTELKLNGETGLLREHLQAAETIEKILRKLRTPVAETTAESPEDEAEVMCLSGDCEVRETEKSRLE